MAAWTSFRTSGRTFGEPLTTRDTVARETPARWATSSRVVLVRRVRGLGWATVNSACCESALTLTGQSTSPCQESALTHGRCLSGPDEGCGPVPGRPLCAVSVSAPALCDTTAMERRC